MNSNHRPESIDVETGRLNAALREVLTDLNVKTSDERRSTDAIITVTRTPDGMMSVNSPDVTANATLESLSRMIVAGANIVGDVQVRARVDEAGDAVFVSVWTV